MPRKSNEAEQDVKTVADQMAERLAIAGAERIYAIVGDSLNGPTGAIRRQGKIEWLRVRRTAIDLAGVADVGATLKALLPRLKHKHDDTHLARSQRHFAEVRRELHDIAEDGMDSARSPDPLSSAKPGPPRTVKTTAGAVETGAPLRH
jgi:thiamine pyrophosphate-dependent acetolactate synthase large subunit-like protein